MKQDRSAFPISGAFEISADDLTGIESLIARHTQSKPASILRLERGFESRFSSVADLLQDSFLHSRGIQSVVLDGRSDALNITVEMRPREIGPIEVRLLGERNAILAFEVEIKNQFEKSRLWYSWIKAPFGHDTVIVALRIILYFFAFLMLGFALAANWSGKGVSSNALNLTFFALTLCIGTKELPTLVFDFGRGQKRWSRVRKIAGVLILGVGLATLVNWLSSAINPLQ